MAAETFSRVIAALLVLLAMGVAEEAVRRGARRILSFCLAVAAASLANGLIFTFMWFDIAWRGERSLVLFVLENALNTALWAGLAIIVLYNSAQTARIREGVKQAQMRLVQTERGVLESRLDAARKQIDAPALFQELTQIRDGLRREEPQAAEALESLIRRLRSIQGPSPASETFKGAV